MRTREDPRAASLLGARILIGRIAGLTPSGLVSVIWGGQAAPLPAEVIWQPGRLDWARCSGLRALLALTEEGRPAILGLLDPPPESAQHQMPSTGTTSDAATRQMEGVAGRPEHLVVESGSELILQCGQAKITLRADGRITIQGGYILSRAKGVNKIKGGSVEIN